MLTIPPMPHAVDGKYGAIHALALFGRGNPRAAENLKLLLEHKAGCNGSIFLWNGKNRDQDVQRCAYNGHRLTKRKIRVRIPVQYV